MNATLFVDVMLAGVEIRVVHSLRIERGDKKCYN